MNLESEKLNSSFLAVVVFLQLAMLVAILLNIAVARQVFGFLYLTFVPGFLIVKLLKFREFDATEVLLFSVGLSLAFLMFVGLVINEFSFLSVLSKPLSITPLLGVLAVVVFVIGISAYLRRSRIEPSRTEPIGFSQKIFLSLLSVPPILSVIGAIWVNTHGNNLILLSMIAGIALLFGAGVLSTKLLPPRFYPVLLLSVAISLLFHASFASNYIFMGDIHNEYFVFKTTENFAQWNPVFINPSDLVLGRLYSMLSVTILPTIYSNTLNLDATWVFKILFLVILSMVPVALYKLWEPNIGAKRALLASFLFMAMDVFYSEMLGLARQMIAELFLILLLLVFLKKNIKPLNRMILFTVFGTALIASHYALAEILLVLLSISLVLLIVRSDQSKRITVTMIVLLFTLMFGWYIYTANSSVFITLRSFGEYVLGQLGSFFDPASRGQTVLRGLGLEAAPSIWNSISRLFAYMTQALIVIGFLTMLLKQPKRFEKDYFVFSLVAFFFLIALIAVPGLASTLNMSRFYHLLLVFLAPFCILGADPLVRIVSKRRTQMWSSILLLAVLLPYFLFQTNFVYEVAGVRSWSVPLSKYRMDGDTLMYSFAYVNSWKESGALWLSSNVGVNNDIYADGTAFELASYGMLQGVMGISDTAAPPSNGLVYLSYLNVVEGIIVTPNYRINSTELTYIYNMPKIFDNGGGQIYAQSR